MREVYKKITLSVNYNYRFIGRIHNNSVFWILFVYQNKIKYSNLDESDSDTKENDYHDECSLIQKM